MGRKAASGDFRQTGLWNHFNIHLIEIKSSNEKLKASGDSEYRDSHRRFRKSDGSDPSAVLLSIAEFQLNLPIPQKCRCAAADSNCLALRSMTQIQTDSRGDVIRKDNIVGAGIKKDGDVETSRRARHGDRQDRFCSHRFAH